MSTENIILVLSLVTTFGLLLLFVPKSKMLQAHISFLFMQVITWGSGLIVVEMRWLEYPVRFFDYATRTSFTFEYFIYPSIAILFNLYFPEGKSVGKRCSHYILYCSTLTLIEVIMERNTQLILYHHWNWYWTWISLFISFYLNYRYYRWFLRKARIDDMEVDRTINKKPDSFLP